MSTSVLILGVTGYVGGSILYCLKEAHPDFKYATLVRNPRDVLAVETFGCEAVQGSNDDLALIEKLSSEYDVVINTADSDGVPFIKAIIAGLTARAKVDAGRRRPILIQTSGTALVVDAPTGSFNEEHAKKIWNDNSVEDIESIDKDSIHRGVDLEVFQASQKGEIDGYVISPCTIYGKGRGPVRNTSIQIPGLIRHAVSEKQTKHLGAGTNQWDCVHIDDNSELYLLLLDHALSGKNTNKSYANFFFSSVGTYIVGEVANKLAAILYKKGLVNSPTSQSVDPSIQPIPTPLIYLGNNCHTVSERGVKQLGWKPTGKKLEEALEEEVELVVSQL